MASSDKIGEPHLELPSLSKEAKLAALEASKKDAISREDYAEAQRIKSEIEALRSEGNVAKLKELEQQKKDAVFREDFEEAQRIKSEIEALRPTAKPETNSLKNKDQIGVVHPETTILPAASSLPASSSTSPPVRPLLDRLRANESKTKQNEYAAPTPAPATLPPELATTGHPVTPGFTGELGFTGGVAVSTTVPLLASLPPLPTEDRGYSLLGSSGMGLLFCVLGSVMFAGYRRLKGHAARRGYTNVRDKGWNDVETVDEEFGLDGASQVRRPPARAFGSGTPAARVVGIGSSNGQDDVLSSNIAFGEEESLDDFFTTGGGTFGEDKTAAPAAKASPQPITSGMDDLFGDLPSPEAVSTDVRIVGGELKF